MSVTKPPFDVVPRLHIATKQEVDFLQSHKLPVCLSDRIGWVQFREEGRDHQVLPIVFWDPVIEDRRVLTIGYPGRGMWSSPEVPEIEPEHFTEEQKRKYWTTGACEAIAQMFSGAPFTTPEELRACGFHKGYVIQSERTPPPDDVPTIPFRLEVWSDLPELMRSIWENIPRLLMDPRFKLRTCGNTGEFELVLNNDDEVYRFLVEFVGDDSIFQSDPNFGRDEQFVNYMEARKGQWDKKQHWGEQPFHYMSKDGKYGISLSPDECGVVHIGSVQDPSEYCWAVRMIVYIA